MRSDPRAKASEIGPAVVILILVLAVQAVTFCLVMWPYREADQLLIAYPFWWPDTFDWTKQAIVILDRYSERVSDYIEVWRPRDPFFLGLLVLALGLDAEWLLLVALGVCNICFVVGSLKLGRALGLTLYDSALVAVLITLNYSFRIFSLHIMGDFFAITAMVWVTLILVRILRSDPMQFTPLGAFAAYSAIALSSTTQIFTLIPGIIFSIVYFFIHGRNVSVLRRLQNILIGFAIVALIRWIVGFVKKYFFGTNLDDRMKFLKVTFDSVEFYSEALLVLSIPVLAIVLMRLATNRKLIRFNCPSTTQIFLVCVILTFGMLIISYSTWREARLLTFFLPFLYLLLIALFPRDGTAGRRLATLTVPVEIVLGILLTVTPVDFIMGPTLPQYFHSASSFANLLSRRTLIAGVGYPAESMRLQECVVPDDSSATAGAGLFTIGGGDCDPYLHYNLKVYWCFKAGVKRCFKGAS